MSKQFVSRIEAGHSKNPAEKQSDRLLLQILSMFLCIFYPETREIKTSICSCPGLKLDPDATQKPQRRTLPVSGFYESTVSEKYPTGR